MSLRVILAILCGFSAFTVKQPKARSQRKLPQGWPEHPRRRRDIANSLANIERVLLKYGTRLDALEKQLPKP